MIPRPEVAAAGGVGRGRKERGMTTAELRDEIRAAARDFFAPLVALVRAVLAAFGGDE